jgi:hypothetical protein
MIDQETLDIGYMVFGFACLALCFWLWLHANDEDEQ